MNANHTKSMEYCTMCTEHHKRWLFCDIVAWIPQTYEIYIKLQCPNIRVRNESYVSFSIIAIQHCAILDKVVPTNRAIFRNVRGNRVSPCDTHVCCLNQISNVRVAMIIFVLYMHISLHWYWYIHISDCWIDINFQHLVPGVITLTVLVSKSFIQIKTAFKAPACIYDLPLQ